jgi:tetratricopeptide (TPR) repeat protein
MKSIKRIIVSAMLLISGLLMLPDSLKAQSAIGQLETLTGRRIDRYSSSSNNSYSNSNSNSYTTARYDKAANINSKGTQFFRNGDYKAAVSAYNIALWYSPFDANIKQNLINAKEALKREKSYAKSIAHVTYKPTLPPPQPTTASATPSATPTSSPYTITTLDGKTRRLNLSSGYYWTNTTPNEGIEEEPTSSFNLEDCEEYKKAEALIEQVGQFEAEKLPAAIGTFMLHLTNNTFTAVNNSTSAFIHGTLSSEDMQQLNVSYIINKTLQQQASDKLEDVASEPIEEMGIGVMEKYGLKGKLGAIVGIKGTEDIQTIWGIHKAPSFQDQIK